MFKLVRFFRNLKRLDACLKENEKKQRANGYRIEFTQEGPERHIFYLEGDREILIHAEFTILNDVLLFTNSLRKWHKPPGDELSDFDYQKVLNRAISYFSCWGEVILNNAPLKDTEELKESLREAGIPYEELEGGIIQYTSTVEEERKRKGGFFNR